MSKIIKDAAYACISADTCFFFLLKQQMLYACMIMILLSLYLLYCFCLYYYHYYYYYYEYYIIYLLYYIILLLLVLVVSYARCRLLYSGSCWVKCSSAALRVILIRRFLASFTLIESCSSPFVFVYEY